MNAKGADYSHFQSWAVLTGNDFVFLKATQGDTFQDPTFKARWASLKSLGIPRGAYHFGEGIGGTGAHQADYFLDYVQPGEDDMIILDWEWPTQGPTAMSDDQVVDFIARVQDREGRKPIIYTGANFEPASYASANIAACDLWCWRLLGNIVVPVPWDTWTFLQTSSGVVDGDEFNGSVTDLAEYLGGEMALADFEHRALASIAGGDDFLNGKDRPTDATKYTDEDGGNRLPAAQRGWDDKKAEVEARGGASGVPDHTHAGGTTGPVQP